MKHWLGVLCIAAVCALIGLVIPGDTEAGEGIRTLLIGLGVVLGAIALLKIGTELMRSSD